MSDSSSNQNQVSTSPLPISTPFLPSSTTQIHGPHQDLIQFLFKLLSSTSTSTVSPLTVSSNNLTPLAPPSISSSVKPETVTNLKSHKIVSPCASSSSSSSLSVLPCNKVTNKPFLSSPVSAQDSVSNLLGPHSSNPALINLLSKLLASVSALTTLPDHQVPFAPSSILQSSSTSNVAPKPMPGSKSQAVYYPDTLSSGHSSFSPSVSSSFPHGSVPSAKYSPASITSSAVSALDTMLTSFGPPGLNQDFINHLIKLLTSVSVPATLPDQLVPFVSPSILQFSPTSNFTPVPIPDSKSHKISPLCTSSSSTPSNVLPCPPFGKVSPSKRIPAPGLPLPVPTPTPLETSGFLQKFMDLLQKPSSVTASSTSPAFHPPPLPPLLKLFTPALNTTPVTKPISKPHTMSSPCAPLPGSNSYLSKLPDHPILSSKSNSIPVISVSTTISAPISAQTPNPTSALTSVSTTEPLQIPSSPVILGHNSSIINLLFKNLFTPTPKASSTPVSTVSSASLTPSTSALRPLFTPTVSTPPVSTAIPERHNISSSCSSSSGSSSCLSNSLSNVSYNSTQHHQQIPEHKTSPPVPLSILTATSGVSSGYNPAFMKLLLKQLLSESASLSPPIQLSLSTLNTTPISTSIPDEFPKSVPYKAVDEPNPGVFISFEDSQSDSAAASASVQTTTSSIPSSHNEELRKYLLKFLSNYQEPLSSPNSLSTSTVHTAPISTEAPSQTSSSPSVSSDVTISNSLSEFISLTSGPNLSTQLDPTSVKPNHIQESVEETTAEIDSNSESTSAPKLSSLLSHKPCCLKHRQTLQSSDSVLSVHDPCFQKIKRPLTSSLSSPCSLTAPRAVFRKRGTSSSSGRHESAGDLSSGVAN